MRGRRHVDQVAALRHFERLHMRQRVALRVLGKSEQRCGGGMRQRQVLRVETGQARHLQLLGELARAEGGIELPGRALRQCGAAGLHRGGQCFAISAQHFSRIQPRQPRWQLALRTFGQAEATARQTEPGEAIARAAVFGDRQQQRIAPLGQQLAVGQRARRDDAHHLALDRALGGGDIADLLGHGHRFAELDQPRQIALDRMHRHTGHHDRLTRALPARRQRDVEQAVGLARVVEEDLVEVAHAEEQQRLRMLGLQAQVLRHHRRVGRKVLHRRQRGRAYFAAGLFTRTVLRGAGAAPSASAAASASSGVGPAGGLGRTRLDGLRVRRQQLHELPIDLWRAGDRFALVEEISVAGEVADQATGLGDHQRACGHVPGCRPVSKKPSYQPAAT